MHATMLCLAMVTLGVDVGWRPLPEGGMEYIIQIEPHMLDMLGKGEDVFSDIPPNLRGVRSYRITVGTDELPREGEAPEPAASPLVTPPLPETPATSPLVEPPRYRVPAPTPGFVPPRYPELMLPGSQAAVERPSVPAEANPSALPPWDTPRPLPPPADPRPFPDSREKPALFVDQQQEPARPSPGQAEKQEEAGEPAEPQEPEKPWGPFTLALAAFFGSFGGMLYTGWLAWGYRRQYRSLLERMIDAGDAPADWGETSEAEAGHVSGLPLGEEDEPSGL